MIRPVKLISRILKFHMVAILLLYNIEKSTYWPLDIFRRFGAIRHFRTEYGVALLFLPPHKFVRLLFVSVTSFRKLNSVSLTLPPVA